MNKNTQPTEKPFRHPQGALQLHHCFPTIQGEGPFAGTPAVFVRLAGCNLQCPFCDTDYTSRRAAHSPLEVVSIVRDIRKPPFLVVITGGEPFRQNLTPFVTLLLGLNYRVQIETNGTLFLPDFPYEKTTIVCSPKTGKISYDLAQRVSAFKYVVQRFMTDPRDGLPVSALGSPVSVGVAKPPVGSTAEVYIQPLDEQDEQKNRDNAQEAVQSCMGFGYRLCIQTHKLVNLE